MKFEKAITIETGITRTIRTLYVFGPCEGSNHKLRGLASDHQRIVHNPLTGNTEMQKHILALMIVLSATAVFIVVVVLTIRDNAEKQALIQSHLDQAEKAFHAEDFDETKRHFQEVELILKESGISINNEYYVNFARVENYLGNYEDARRIMETLVSRIENDPSIEPRIIQGAFWQLGLALERSGNLTEAASRIRQVISYIQENQDEPNQFLGKYLEKLASIEYGLENDESAMEMYKKAAEIEEKRRPLDFNLLTDIYRGMARISVRQNQPIKVEYYLRKLLRHACEQCSSDREVDWGAEGYLFADRMRVGMMMKSSQNQGQLKVARAIQVVLNDSLNWLPVNIQPRFINDRLDGLIALAEIELALADEEIATDQAETEALLKSVPQINDSLLPTLPDEYMAKSLAAWGVRPSNLPKGWPKSAYNRVQLAKELLEEGMEIIEEEEDPDMELLSRYRLMLTKVSQKLKS